MRLWAMAMLKNTKAMTAKGMRACDWGVSVARTRLQSGVVAIDVLQECASGLPHLHARRRRNKSNELGSPVAYELEEMLCSDTTGICIHVTKH